MANLFENADGLLSVTDIADMSSAAETTLYTVPTGKTLILTKAYVRVNADLGNSGDCSIGQSGAPTDFIPSTDLDIADAQFDVIVLQPIPSVTPTIARKEYVAAEPIVFDVINAFNAVAATVYLFGILDDA